jgi:hypothetical protein
MRAVEAIRGSLRLDLMIEVEEILVTQGHRAVASMIARL